MNLPSPSAGLCLVHTRHVGGFGDAAMSTWRHPCPQGPGTVVRETHRNIQTRQCRVPGWCVHERLKGSVVKGDAWGRARMSVQGGDREVTPGGRVGAAGKVTGGRNQYRDPGAAGLSEGPGKAMEGPGPACGLARDAATL